MSQLVSFAFPPLTFFLQQLEIEDDDGDARLCDCGPHVLDWNPCAPDVHDGHGAVYVRDDRPFGHDVSLQLYARPA